jgi:hypothetical protein
VPLVIFVNPIDPVALNYTCRYCPKCKLLIAHQDEIEAHLTQIFMQRKPEVIGNDYIVLGTMDRADWKRGLRQPLTFDEMEKCLHDFKQELYFEIVGGWVREQ